jgi:carboxyl-terminal processing protease
LQAIGKAEAIFGKNEENRMTRGRWKIVLVCFSTALTLFLVVGAILGQEKGPKEPYPQLAVLSEVLSRIQTDYVEDPNFSKVTSGALHGLVEALDPYSCYLTPDEYKEYQKKHDDASIGVVVSKRLGFVSLVSVLPNSPAQKAGLQAGDVIESIDGHSTREMPLAQVVYRMEGAPGSVLALAIVRERAAEPKSIDLRRAFVVPPDASGRMMETGIGYLRVESFPKGETQKIATRLQELRKGGAKKFVLDLRDNAFGESDEGISTANLFLSKGLIGYLSGQQFPRKSFLADSSKAIAEEPLVVLVNQSTGGAAEIVASAILDNHRGEVVGERTYGIGSLQKTIPLDDGSALILSIAKYFTPSGKQIQEGGITPSVVVDEEREFVPLGGGSAAPPEPKKPSEDAPLKRAIQLLVAQVSQPVAA